MNAPHSKPNPTNYVLGFAFDHRNGYPTVCLIRKRRPAWQAGKLNGVGGKIEPAELPVSAMQREFREETGVLMDRTNWVHFHTMCFGNGAVVYCFAGHLPEYEDVATQTDEEVGMYRIGKSGRWFLHHPVIPNLSWLIPMAYHELHAAPSERMLVTG